MFDKIKRMFSQKDVVVETDDNYEITPFENPNFITDPVKIAALLSEIEVSSPLCSVQIEGSQNEYNSSILGIKLDKNLIVFDELIPKDGNFEIQKAPSVKMSTFHKGVHLSFTLTGVETGYSKGITYYRAAIPDRIYYPQRRRAPRIEISSIDIGFSGVSERTGISVTGYLFDLSRGGAGIDVPVNRARVQRGDRIKNCQLVLDEYTMDFDFSVRFTKAVPISPNRVQIGGFFENLSSKSEAKLSYFVASLERVEIRKQKA